jgi:hypothetical protein
MHRVSANSQLHRYRNQKEKKEEEELSERAE